MSHVVYGSVVLEDLLKEDLEVRSAQSADGIPSGGGGVTDVAAGAIGGSGVALVDAATVIADHHIVERLGRFVRDLVQEGIQEALRKTGEKKKKKRRNSHIRADSCRS